MAKVPLRDKRKFLSIGNLDSLYYIEKSKFYHLLYNLMTAGWLNKWQPLQGGYSSKIDDSW